MDDVIARNEFAEIASDVAAHAESWMDDIRLYDQIQPWADQVLEISDKYNSIILHEDVTDDVVEDAGKTVGAIVRARAAVVELYNALYACAEQADEFHQKYGKE